MTPPERALLSDRPERPAAICPKCAPTVAAYCDWKDAQEKRQGDRAHKWKTRAEAAALQLRYAIDALEGSPWTGWSTGDARDFLMRPESPAASDEEGRTDG